MSQCKSYFYILQHKDPCVEVDKYYAGSKYADGCDPSQLLNADHKFPYFTSSSRKEIVESIKNGAYFIRTIIEFDRKESALLYETRFLRKVNAIKNKKFANLSITGSYDCSDPLIVSKRKQTCIETYGVDNPFKSDEIKEVITSRHLENLGVPYPMMSSSVRKKSRETVTKRYGVDHISKVPHISDRRKQTCIETYGVDNPFKSDEIKSKIKDSVQRKFGVDHPSQSQEIKLKKEETSIRNYGVAYAMQSDQYKENRKQKFLDTIGVEHPSKTDEVKKRIQDKAKEKASRPLYIKYRDLMKSMKLKMPRGACNVSDDKLIRLIEESENV